MQTMTVQVNDNQALKTLRELEGKHLISILDNATTDVPSLPGAEISMKEFEDWIKKAEGTQTVSLTEAKEKWAGKRKQLRNLIE